MKILLTGFMFLLANAASAKTCVVLKEGNCLQAKKVVCANVSEIDVEYEDQSTLYQLDNIKLTLGCNEWGLPRLFSKNRLCRLILNNKKARYVKGSSERGQMHTALGFNSIGTIECFVKGNN
jgi:hypothetical protein